MSKEMSDILKTVDFISIKGSVVILEYLFKTFISDAIQLAEMLTNESVEGRVRMFLRAIFDDHVCHFDLIPWSES